MRLGIGLSWAARAVLRTSLGLGIAASFQKMRCEEAAMKDQSFEVSKQEEDSVALSERIRAEQNLSNLNRIVLLNASEYKEGQVYGHEIIINERKIRLVVIKHKDQFYCLGGTCAYDGKTKLSDGVVFGDKLLAPENGSAYNITNGQAEHGPAIDNIPIFEARVDKQSGKLTVFVPDVPPKKIKPLIVGRDFNDLRRVVLIGSDPSVITCAETLRLFEYSVNFVDM